MPKFAQLGLAITLLLGGINTEVMAAAPQVKTQAPGFYRMMLGDFEITALNDGTRDLPVDKLLKERQPGQVLRALQHAYLGLPLETSFNGFLINTGAKLVLVDSGGGGNLGPTLGRLITNLKAAGYQPEQVDEVYITHLHSDHISGVLSEGKAAFPNATLRMDQREADFWLSEENAAKVAEGARGTFTNARAAVKPYQEAGSFKPFEGDAKTGVELVPGIRALSTYGHTPGHSVYLVESKGQKLAVWGDLMHVAAVQLPDPTVTISFDSDASLAQPQREKAMADAAEKGYYVALAHSSFPGIGRLRPDGKGYVWLPPNYSSKP